MSRRTHPSRRQVRKRKSGNGMLFGIVAFNVALFVGAAYWLTRPDTSSFDAFESEAVSDLPQSQSTPIAMADEAVETPVAPKQPEIMLVANKKKAKKSMAAKPAEKKSKGKKKGKKSKSSMSGMSSKSGMSGMAGKDDDFDYGKSFKFRVPTRQVPSPSEFVETSNRPTMPASRQAQHTRKIDEMVNQFLKQKGIRSGPKVNDHKFLRRAYLDIAGRIPTIQENEDFISSGSPDKREQLIDELFNSAGYVSHSHNYWLDALRATSKTKKASGESYILWIRKAVQYNMPYDEFARRLISAEGQLADPHNAAAGYYLRDSMMLPELVSNTMQLFLATDMVCAQCHDHPFSDWTQMDFFKIAAFFDGTQIAHGGRFPYTQQAVKQAVKQGANEERAGKMYNPLNEGVYRGGSGMTKLPRDYKYDDGKPNQVIKAGVPFGKDIHLDYDNKHEYAGPATVAKFRLHLYSRGDIKARKAFAEWVASAENPMFTKTIINRLWDRVFGAPVVGELMGMEEDDFGMHPQLTRYLINLMKESGFDQKQFMKILFKTDLYQREAVDTSETEYALQGPVVERLSAEQIWDSLLALRSTNPDRGVTTGNYIGSNVTFVEMIQRSDSERLKLAVAVSKSGKKTHPLRNAPTQKELIMKKPKFSNGVRASLRPSPARSSHFLSVYGQSPRQIIDEYSKESTIPQALRLMNNDDYSEMGKDHPLLKKLGKNHNKFDQRMISTVFNAVLVRNPSQSELSGLKRYFQSGNNDMEDLLWALINSTEFKVRM